jgi:hypothetical protein
MKEMRERHDRRREEIEARQRAVEEEIDKAMRRAR